MNRANQQALFQQTNQAVLQIRQLEINYYTNLYNVFGTQALLVGGFVYGTHTQNEIRYSNWQVLAFLYLYYMTAAMTIALSLHIMLSTMFLQVCGPGLALHGPLGSMAKATEGLKEEQKQVITSFIFMIICFALSTVFVFWMIMAFNTALTCSTFFLVAARYWWYYSERIYLRFYWEKNETNWNNGGVEDDLELDDAEPQIPGATSNPLHNAGNTEGPFKEKKLGFPFALPFGKKNTEDAASGAAPEASATSPVHNQGTAIWGDAKGVDLSQAGHKALVAMEGYLTARVRTTQAVVLETKRWERQYFVLFRTGEIFVYKTRQNFRTDPKNPVQLRPLKLTDFFVAVINKEKDLRAEFDDDTKTVSSAASVARGGDGKPMPFRFQLTLVPRENEESFDLGKVQLRNHWMLRCDTEEELEIWLTIIREICPSCFRE